MKKKKKRSCAREKDKNNSCHAFFIKQSFLSQLFLNQTKHNMKTKTQQKKEDTIKKMTNCETPLEGIKFQHKAAQCSAECSYRIRIWCCLHADKHNVFQRMRDLISSKDNIRIAHQLTVFTKKESSKPQKTVTHTTPTQKSYKIRTSEASDQ